MDSGDLWRVVKEESLKRRASNRDKSPKILQREGVDFEARSRGAHIIVSCEEEPVADFWPGTGYWKFRHSKDPNKHPWKGHGVFNLIKRLKAEGLIREGANR